MEQIVPLVTEIKIPSPIRTSAETGDDNNQLSQPDTKDETSNVKKKFKSNTPLSTNSQLREAENLTES